MDKSMIEQTAADEVAAASNCMRAALNNLAGPYGKAYDRCVSDLYYACYHLARALLASRGIGAASHEAVQRLIALHFVKPAALPQDTTAKFNELMDKRHAADYRPYVAFGPRDVAQVRPWICGFARAVLDLMGGAAPAAEAMALRELAGAFERIGLE